MHNVVSGASVSFIEHRFIDNQCCFDVLSGFSDVSFHPLRRWKKSRMSVETPFHVTGVCTTFASFCSCLKYHMWMFLLKKESCAVTVSSEILAFEINCDEIIVRKILFIQYGIFYICSKYLQNGIMVIIISRPGPLKEISNPDLYGKSLKINSTQWKLFVLMRVTKSQISMS